MKKLWVRYYLILFTVSLFSIVYQTTTAQVYNFYFGNIHAHSKYSDGNQANDTRFYSAKPCFQYARTALHADFLGISDHNHSQAGMSLPDFHKGLLEADSVNQDNIFTALYGIEYGVINNGGHVLVYGIDSLIGWEAGNYDIYNAEYDYNALFTKIVSHPGSFAYFAHMQSTDYGNIITQPYNATWDSAIVGLAMRSGPAFSTDTSYTNNSTSTYNSRYQDLLKKGYHVGVGMDQDNHNITFEKANKARTVIIAESLTRANIMSAYRHRRFYATDDWNAKINYTINGNRMGSLVNFPSNPIINITMNDDDNETASSIKLWYGVPGSGTTATVLTTATNTNTLNITPAIPLNSTYYYYAEITQADGDKIWTSPIWYTKSNSTQPLTLNLTSFIAGYYTGNKLMNPIIYNNSTSTDPTACDSITIVIHNSTSPYATVATARTLLHSNGTSSVILPASLAGNWYYIAIRSRNALETWSKNPVLFDSYILKFDFK